MGPSGQACAPLQERWEQLFVDHHAPVLATCRAILRHREEAEDATQEVFARVPVDATIIIDVRRWLLQVARNVCIDMLRRRHRRPTVALELMGDRPSLRDAGDPVIERLFAHWVLDQLPAREEAVLSRQLLLDEPLAVVAAEMGVSYAMAGKLAARARRRAVEIATAPEASVRNESRSRASSSLVVHGIPRGAVRPCHLVLGETCAAG